MYSGSLGNEKGAFLSVHTLVPNLGPGLKSCVMPDSVDSVYI